MKIMVTSQGNGLNSLVDPRLGRAAWFLVYDSETAAWEAVRNTQGSEASQGAGIKAAETISRMGVGVVITGHCGPKAFHALKAAGIQVVLGAEGEVGSALEKFTAAQLRPSESSDVDGHWL